MTGIDLPGFADPVSQAQSCFRAVLDAMARPGCLRVAGLGLTPPALLDPATAAVLLTLVDADSPLWIAPEHQATAEWLAFHCSALPVADVATAAFVLTGTLPDMASLANGTDEAPELGATVILQLPELGTGRRWRLTGPGLAAPQVLRAALPEDFAARWAANHAAFPRGVDIVLCAGTSLAALPRSVAVTEG